jgi:ABC-type sugar transport system ATPase subunit
MGSVELKNVRKWFGAFEAICGIDLTINQGELVVFVGPSGCGKSTLLRMIAGLEETDEGSIFITNRDVTFEAPARRGVAMVFQSYALYPHMTAYENMAYGLRRAGIKGNELDTRVRQTAKMLQIEALLDRKPAAMSGGQRQRVAIGRAIVRKPQVFLFDEPLSNLDAALRVETRAQIARLHRELGATMIFVTHDQVEAMTLASRIVVLRAGAIEQVGTPHEIYHKPANIFVAGFIGSPTMNLIPVVSDGQAITLNDTVIMKHSKLPIGALAIGIRPNHLVLDPKGPLSGTVSLIEDLGDEAVIHISPVGLKGSWRLKTKAGFQLSIGDMVAMSINPEGVCFFDQSGSRVVWRD